MRTEITVDGGDVTVERDDLLSGERTCTTYFVGGSGYGYVRIRDEAGRFPQVCERLSSTGSTLECYADNLPAVIRRELRRRVAAERRELRGH